MPRAPRFEVTCSAGKIIFSAHKTNFGTRNVKQSSKTKKSGISLGSISKLSRNTLNAIERIKVFKEQNFGKRTCNLILLNNQY